MAVVLHLWLMAVVVIFVNGCCSTSVVNGCCRVVESAGEVVLVGCGNGCCGNAVVLHLWLMAVAESLNQREK